MATDMKHRVVSPSSEIIGEGAAIFTDMMETILDPLDQQMLCHLIYRNQKVHQ